MILGVAVAILSPSFAWAYSPDLCLRAASDVSAKSDLPAGLLPAIALVETGRAANGVVRPWPWTLNIDGKGYWFSSKAAAAQAARKAIASGATQIDLGCFQLNHHWHGDAFTSIEQMLNPADNASYAAKFLADLKAELGSWDAAVGAYHSRTGDLADAYLARVKGQLKTVMAVAKAPVQNVTSMAPKRHNPFPLLQGRIGGATAGSLVPLFPRSDARPFIVNGYDKS